MSDAPSWMQGIAAIIALGLSTWANVAPARAKKRDEASRAEAIAVSIWPDVLFVTASIERAEQVLRQHPFSKLPDGQVAPLPNPNAVIASGLRQAVIGVPTMLARQATKVWQLGGDAGVTVAQMIALLYQWDTLVEKAAFIIENGQANDIAVFCSLLQGNLKALKTSAAEASMHIKKIHP
jgi:hypothetical protein